MALGTEEAQYNLDVDIFIAAMKTFWTAAAANEVVPFAMPRPYAGVRGNPDDIGDDGRANYGATPVWDVQAAANGTGRHGNIAYADNRPDGTNIIPWALNNGVWLIPAKITNLAGDLS
jgi:hypothetical protein